MKFLVTRTSQYPEWDDNDQMIVPCPLSEAEQGALRMSPTKEKYDNYDCRSVDDPTKIPAYEGQDPSWWYGEGEDHKVVDGRIQRRFPNAHEGFFLDVPSLDFLMKLRDVVGPFIIKKSWSNPYIDEIEIYDDYRE